jgi:hypothetical protein
MFDIDGTLTENSTEAITYVYEVTLRHLIWGKTVSNINIVTISTEATIEFDLPEDVQLSGNPLSGKFKIKCTDSEGYESYSNVMGLNTGPNWANHELQGGCDKFYDATEMFDTNEFPSYSNYMMGRSWLIRFIGYNKDPGQFVIVSAEDDDALTGTDENSFYSNTTVEYGSSLFYEPVPFEFLRTYEETP